MITETQLRELIKEKSDMMQHYGRQADRHLMSGDTDLLHNVINLHKEILIEYRLLKSILENY